MGSSQEKKLIISLILPLRGRKYGVFHLTVPPWELIGGLEFVQKEFRGNFCIFRGFFLDVNENPK